MVFTATGTTTPTGATIAAGDQQVNNISATFLSPLTVAVKDAQSAGVQGVPVTFTITSGGGTLNNTVVGLSAVTTIVVPTDAQGIATANWVGSSTITTGTATATASNFPALTFNTRTVASTSDNTHCELTTTGAAYCWGNGTLGQIGDGTNLSKNVPTVVSGGLSFTKLSDGFADHTCGITSSGQAYCWGANGFGQLGDGSTTDRNVPVAVAGGLSFARITVSLSASCGITTANTLVCWGSNGYSYIGDGKIGTVNLVPTPVTSGGVNFNRVAVGQSHVCAVATAGSTAGDSTRAVRLRPACLVQLPRYP